MACQCQGGPRRLSRGVGRLIAINKCEVLTRTKAAEGTMNNLKNNDRGAPRVISGIILAGGLILIGINEYVVAMEKRFYIAAAFFAPPFIFIGLAGLIRPEIGQAVFRHTRNRLDLPLWSIVVGWSLIFIGFIAGAILVVWMKA